MKEWIGQLRRLSEMLEREVSGYPFDHHEAREIVHRLADRFPHIGGSLGQIRRRLDTFGPGP